MTTLTSKLTLASTALFAPCAANAHTGHHGAVSIYHYLVSADHIAVLALMGATIVGLALWHSRKVDGSAKKKV